MTNRKFSCLRETKITHKRSRNQYCLCKSVIFDSVSHSAYQLHVAVYHLRVALSHPLHCLITRLIACMEHISHSRRERAKVPII